MVYKKTNKIEEHKDAKRKLIFKTASRIFAENGYHQTTVKDITDAAGISVGTFYIYFKNKEDLFEKLYDEMASIIQNLSSYAREKDACAAEKFTRVIASTIWGYQMYKELSKILLIEAVGLNSRFETKYSELMKDSCDSMEETLNYLKEKELVDVPDTRVAAIAYEGAFNHTITYWLRNDYCSDLSLYAYPLAVFSLQALKIDFQHDKVRDYIQETFNDIENTGDRFLN